MDKDDSNGTSLEIVDKKAVEQASMGEKTGASSSVTSTKIHSTSPGSVPTGNLLSNVGPPASIPDFTLWKSSSDSEDVRSKSSNMEGASPQVSDFPILTTTATVTSNLFPTTHFSAAIPPNKGIPQVAISQPRVIQPPEAEAVAPSSFLGLVKGALTSQVMSKMVEKAKSSVDSIITTLDPQMSEYIYSGGDLEITVASEEEDIVSGVREAAHSIFGKAWVNGIKLGNSPQKSQAVGIDCGLILAEERIDYSLKFRKTPTIAIESVLLKEANSWFDVSLLVLKDAEHDVNIHTFSQATPVPTEKFIDKEVADIDIEHKLSEYLKVVPCWQEEVSGLARKEVISLAARVLFKLYKDRLPKIQVKST